MSSVVPVSVVIPCYCCLETIERAVKSVMSQTVLPAEIWLVEDGSTDGGRTLATLYRLRGRYSERTRIEVVPLGRNRGPSVARNTGWNAATQSYVAFLDADDAWHSRKLEIQYDWMRGHPNVAMTGHRWLWIRPGQSIPELAESPQAWHISPLMQLLSNRFSTITVMLRRDLPYRFSESKRRCEDFDLWLRLVLDGCSAWYINVVLAYLYKAPYGEGGLSENLWKMEKTELEVYWQQVREGRLRLMAFALLAPWLVTKHLRRLVNTAIRKGGPSK